MIQDLFDKYKISKKEMTDKLRYETPMEEQDFILAMHSFFISQSLLGKKNDFNKIKKEITEYIDLKFEELYKKLNDKERENNE